MLKENWDSATQFSHLRKSFDDHVLQVRVGGVQLAVLAGAGPRDSRQELLPPDTRPGPDPALPRPGRPRLTRESLVWKYSQQ